jgi:hypothetical protein
MAATKKQMTTRQAEALWSQLHEHFVNAQQAIKDIIAAQAWLPLGYTTFFAAWADRMADVTLAAEIRRHVICQMLAEGLTPDEVASATKGVGPETVTEIDRQRKNGVPAERVHVVVRHRRANPSPPKYLTLELGVAKMREYRRVAAIEDRSVEDIAFEAISDRFAMIVASQTRRKAS